MKKLRNIASISFSLLVGVAFGSPPKDNKPNIILILADDMGFSDIGCYGGEINTPNLDRMAQGGVRYSQFYNAARCCPTRASLLTGVYPHQAGMGWMNNADEGTPGYRGDLSKHAVTIAEVLKTAGYSTCMTGKWHLSNTRKDHAGINDNWPVQRGFDRFFGIISGSDSYFNPVIFSDNKKYPAPPDFYLTHAISDSTVKFIGQHFNNKPDEPLFLYVAYTAPHWPLHALEEDIKKYREVYRQGWDQLRGQRLQKQYGIGLWENDLKLAPRDANVPAWHSLSAEEKDEFALKMAIYAAQVDAMDQGIGRIVQKLEEVNQLENSVIFFLSDNGGCAEHISSGKSKDLTGNLANTWESYRINWANLSNTPFREYKHYTHEGGIRTPLIVHWPNGVGASLQNSFVRDYGHVTDLMATCLELAFAEYPKKYQGNEIVPKQGKSLLPLFLNQKTGRGPIFWEHEANIGMREGDWKLVAETPSNGKFSMEKLELYNMGNDPTELNDLAEAQPEKRDRMYAEWQEWAENTDVFPLDTRDYGIRSRDYKRKINGQFDLDFGDWDILNPNQHVAFSIDRKAKISGRNAAKINVKEKNPDAMLIWSFPPGEFKQFEINFKALANTKTTFRVKVGHMEMAEDIFAESVFSVNQKVQTFKLKTKEINKPGWHQLLFSFENTSEGDEIWLDEVQLVPIK
jgi:arylsulfatase